MPISPQTPDIHARRLGWSRSALVVWLVTAVGWVVLEGWRWWEASQLPLNPAAWHAGDRAWSRPTWPMPGVLDFGAAVRPVEGDAAVVLPDGAAFDWGRYAGSDDRFTLHLRVRLKPAAEPPGFPEHYLFSWMAGGNRGVLKVSPGRTEWEIQQFESNRWTKANAFSGPPLPLGRWFTLTIRSGGKSWDWWVDGKRVAGDAHSYSPLLGSAVLRFMGNAGEDRVSISGGLGMAEADVGSGIRKRALADPKIGLETALDDLVLYDRWLSDAEVGALSATSRSGLARRFDNRDRPHFTIWTRGFLGLGALLALLHVGALVFPWLGEVVIGRDYRPVQWSFVLGATVTAVLAWMLHREAVRSDEARFRNMTETFSEYVETHFEKIAAEVNRVRDWVSFQSRLEPEAWFRWVESGSVLYEHSGLIGIGYAMQVRPEGVQRHESEWRSRWGPSYGIVPKEAAWTSSSSPVLFEGQPRLPVVLYACAEPRPELWRTNQTILGRDLLIVDPLDRAVVPEAIRIQDAVGYRGMSASGSVRIAPPEWFGAPVDGLRLYVPNLIGPDEVGGPIPSAAWHGVAFASIDLRRWFLSDLKEMSLVLGCRIHSGDGTGQRHELLLDMGELFPAAARPEKPRLESTIELKHYGSRLWIDCWTTPGFLHESRAHWPWVAGFGGGGFTLLTALALGFQVRARLRERSYARQLAEANAALAKVQRERERLSRDLHDGSIQSLYAVGLHLRSARRQVSAAEQELGTGLAECQRLVQTSILELRDFLLRLKEESGPTRTYREVMDEWVRRLRRISSEDIELVAVPGSDALPARVVIELVQITREAVSNAMRHAGADRIVVTLGPVATDGRQWALEIQDDGKGWREEPASGVGFRSMRERAAEIGGRLEIRSQMGDGTRVRVTFEVEVVRLAGTS